jgi:two-component system sensor histidine kinase QseC
MREVASVSIRRRLLVLLLATVTGVWGLAALATWSDAHREADRLLDAHLAQAASLLIAETGHELLELGAGELLDPDEYAEGVTFQAWLDGTELIVKSADAPGVRFSPRDEGFADSELMGRRWRVFTARDRQHGLVIEVAEDHAVRERIAARVALNALVPLALALPVLALLVWLSVGRALAPLAQLGEQIRNRQPLAPDPIGLPDAPAEVQPLVARLNELFERIRHSTELERRFTADASHELRNPVAAIRAQAEVACSTPDAATRARALEFVVLACQRMAALMDQLLMLARLDQDRSGAVRGRHDLAAIARRAVAEIAPAALTDSGAQLELDAGGDTHVTGEPELLATLVRNLVLNAVRHGGSDVHVTVSGDGTDVRLEVTDSGPGVPPEHLAHLGERFFRGAAEGEGSGLGLSIVRRIAEMHGADVAFAPGPGNRGLRVTVTFH